MTNQSPKVTIAIPTFNRADWLSQAIDSALAQTYPNIEIIVSNNASTDTTRELLSRYEGRVTVLDQSENLGMTGNWQECLSAAHGDFFLLLSDDDYLEPDGVRQLVNGFGAEPSDVAFVYGRTAVLNADGSIYHHPVTPPACESATDFVMASYQNRRFSPTGATLLRGDDIRAVGGYTPHAFNLVPDAAVLMKTALLNPGRFVGFVDSVVFNYRVHSASTTSSTKLKVWADELAQLSRIVADLIRGTAPAMEQEFLKLRDRYIVSFILGQVGNNTAQALKSWYCRYMDCYRLCRPYLKLHSVKTFCFGMLSMVFPAFMQKVTQVTNSLSGNHGR